MDIRDFCAAFPFDRIDSGPMQHGFNLRAPNANPDGTPTE